MTTRPVIRLVATAALAAALTLVASTAAAVPPPFVGPDGLAPPPPQPPGDDLQGISIGDAWAYEADGTINFQLTLDEPTDFGDNVDIQFVHLDTDADDFVSSVYNSSFGVGTTDHTLEVEIVLPDPTEPPEAFEMHLANPDGLEIVDGVGEGLLFDADGPTMDLHDAVTEAEGDPGHDVALDFEVELSYAAPEDIDLRFATTAVPGEAEPDTDYESVDVIATVPAGAETVSYPVAVVEDLVTEDALEAVSVWIADPTVGVIQDDTAAGRIEDDDLASITIDDVTEVEGTGGLTDLVFAVTLDQPAPYDIDVDASVVAGTALTPADWQDPGAVTVTIPAGETTQELVVKVVGDATVEADEDLTVVLGNEQMAELGDGVGLGTILDDDEPAGGSEVKGAGVGRTGLPFTGAPTLVLLAASALLLGLGTLLVLWRRRHEAAMA